MLLHRLQHCSPPNAGEGVCNVELHPSAVWPRLRNHLHRVDQSLGPARAPGAVLAASHRLQQGAAVFSHQPPGGELAEALAPSDRANSAPVLEERGELRQRQQVHRGLRDVAVCNPVAEDSQPS